MSIHRTIQHESQLYIVIDVDMRGEQTFVWAAPITGGRINTKTGAVVSVAYDGDKRVKLTNPRMSKGLSGAQLRNAIMESAARLVRPSLSLGNASPELLAIVQKALGA
jgi:hypothetical protein